MICFQYIFNYLQIVYDYAIYTPYCKNYNNVWSFLVNLVDGDILRISSKLKVKCSHNNHMKLPSKKYTVCYVVHYHNMSSCLFTIALTSPDIDINFNLAFM